MSPKQRPVALAGLALVTVGTALLVVGLLSLDATVEGAYFNRATGAEAAPVVATSVSGKGWIIAGTALVAAGGLAFAAATLKGE